jgi:predicted  nucleic acid-binding Zn-ribbon protein
LDLALQQIVHLGETTRAAGEERAAVVNLALDAALLARHQMDELTSQLTAVQQEVVHLSEKLTSSEQQAADLQSEQRTREDLHASLEAASCRLSDVEAQLQNALRARHAEATRAEHLAEQHDVLLRQHESTQAQLMIEIRQLQSHRDELAAALLALSRSESWRLGYALTSPFRRIKRGRRQASRSANAESSTETLITPPDDAFGVKGPLAGGYNL